MDVYILLWWSGRSSNLFGLLVNQRRVDQAVGSGGPFFLRKYFMFFLFIQCIYVVVLYNYVICCALWSLLKFKGIKNAYLLFDWYVVYVGDASVWVSDARSIESTSPHPTSPRSILILSTHLRLGLPSDLFPAGFPTNNLYAFFSSPLCYMARPSHPPRFDYSNHTWRRVQITKFPSCLSSVMIHEC
jgi:hypothetical protein